MPRPSLGLGCPVRPRFGARLIRPAWPTRAWLVLLAVLDCASRPVTPRERLLKAGAAPACVPGTLLFSASQAPRALALSPDGDVVAVADRGALVVCRNGAEVIQAAARV